MDLEPLYEELRDLITEYGLAEVKAALANLENDDEEED